MDRGGALVVRERFENFKLSRAEFFRGQRGDRGVVTLEVFVEPVERRDAEFLRVGVVTGRDGQAQVLRLAVQRVNPRHLGMQASDTVDRENAVAVSVQDEQRTWSDERGDLREVPTVGVHLKHTVAVTLDDAVDHVVLQVGDAGDRSGGLDALVESRDPPTVRAAAASAGDADAGFVDKLKRLEQVDSANPIPRLYPGRRVAS